jgi:hypothetical protein
VIPKIGVFESSLSAEYALTPALWNSLDIGRYACLASVFHINTRYLLLVGLIPEMTAASNEPAYFVGSPLVCDTNDQKYFEESAQERLRKLSNYGITERAVVGGRIS